MPVPVVQPGFVKGGGEATEWGRVWEGVSTVREICENSCMKTDFSCTLNTIIIGVVSLCSGIDQFGGHGSLCPLAMPVTVVQPGFVNGGQSEGAGEDVGGGISTLPRYYREISENSCMKTEFENCSTKRTPARAYKRHKPRRTSMVTSLSGQTDLSEEWMNLNLTPHH